MTREAHGPGSACQRLLAALLLISPLFNAACQDRPWSSALESDGGIEAAGSNLEIWDAAVASLPFDSIRFARGDCSPTCDSDYSITLGRDGGARLVVSGSAPWVASGIWVGEVDTFDYVRLCDMIVARDLLDRLPAESHIKMSHGRGFQLEVWETGAAESRAFRGWETEGPTEAWALRSAIDGIVARIRWGG